MQRSGEAALHKRPTGKAPTWTPQPAVAGGVRPNGIIAGPGFGATSATDRAGKRLGENAVTLRQNG